MLPKDAVTGLTTYLSPALSAKAERVSRAFNPSPNPLPYGEGFSSATTSKEHYSP
jgi:hypothetical protein